MYRTYSWNEIMKYSLGLISYTSEQWQNLNILPTTRELCLFYIRLMFKVWYFMQKNVNVGLQSKQQIRLYIEILCKMIFFSIFVFPHLWQLQWEDKGEGVKFSIKLNSCEVNESQTRMIAHKMRLLYEECTAVWHWF